MSFLSDHHSSHIYLYLINVHTGLRKGAGTQSNIYFTVTGDQCDSGVRLLNAGDPVNPPHLCFVISVIWTVTFSNFFCNITQVNMSNTIENMFYINMIRTKYLNIVYDYNNTL